MKSIDFPRAGSKSESDEVWLCVFQQKLTFKNACGDTEHINSPFFYYFGSLSLLEGSTATVTSWSFSPHCYVQCHHVQQGSYCWLGYMMLICHFQQSTSASIACVELGGDNCSWDRLWRRPNDGLIFFTAIDRCFHSFTREKGRIQLASHNKECQNVLGGKTLEGQKKKKREKKPLWSKNLQMKSGFLCEEENNFFPPQTSYVFLTCRTEWRLWWNAI